MANEKRRIPQAPWIKKKCQDLGGSVWKEYWTARDAYKREGMEPQEARERVYVEQRIAERWNDWRQRRSQAEIVGKNVPLTPAEMKEINPNYKAPSVTKEAEIGKDILSLPEQVRWVKQKLARVRNGGEQPTSFPSADTLYWYQIAVTRPVDFDKLVLKIEAPEKDGENAIMQDGEHQFATIERQLGEAVQEVGNQLVEMESGFGAVIKAIPEKTAA